MKWSFRDRDIGGCVIREASIAAPTIAIIPRDTPNAAGHKRAREIAEAIVIAHNDLEDARVMAPMELEKH